MQDPAAAVSLGAGTAFDMTSVENGTLPDDNALQYLVGTSYSPFDRDNPVSGFYTA